MSQSVFLRCLNFSKQTANVISSEIYRQRFTALKITSENFGNSAESRVFFLDQRRSPPSLGIWDHPLAAALTLTSDVEVK